METCTGAAPCLALMQSPHLLGHCLEQAPSTL